MIVIGLTGPSGSGKGSVAQILSEYGIVCIDADSVYHNLITPPSPCLDEIVECFGYGVLNAGGQLDRAALAKMVFGEDNKEKLERLNAITHKYVCARIRQIIKYYSDIEARACVIDAPLLIESGLDCSCDVVVCVLANKKIRAERIKMRDGISETDAYRRIDSQKPDSYYIEHSDYVIYNDSDMSALKNEVSLLLESKHILEAGS